jgi:two-component system sensor histidine kinase EvgS
LQWKAFGLVVVLTYAMCATAGVGEEPLRCGSEVDYPPFCFVSAEGKAAGISVELMRVAMSAMDRQVSFRTGEWSEVKGWLERGEIEALPLVGRTPEREPLFDFTFPYISLHGAIVVRTDNGDIEELGDLRGRQVAVMEGDNAEEFLRREDRGIDIHTTSTFQEALRELSRGRHDAVFMQRIVALRLLQKTVHDQPACARPTDPGVSAGFLFRRAGGRPRDSGVAE